MILQYLVKVTTCYKDMGAKKTIANVLFIRRASNIFFFFVFIENALSVCFGRSFVKERKASVFSYK